MHLRIPGKSFGPGDLVRDPEWLYDKLERLTCIRARWVRLSILDNLPIQSEPGMFPAPNQIQILKQMQEVDESLYGLEGLEDFGIESFIGKFDGNIEGFEKEQ